MKSLKKYIKDNPHILENRDRIQGVLSDFLSGDKITVKRLMKGYDNGIIDVLNEENVDEDTKNKFLYKLIRKEDLIQDVAIEIFDEWANLLGKNIISNNKIRINNNDNINIISEYDKAKSNGKVIDNKINNLKYKVRNQTRLKNDINKTLNNEVLKEHNNKKSSNAKKRKIIKAQSIKTIVSNNTIMKFFNYIFIISYVVATVTSVLVFIVGFYLTKEEGTQGLPGVIFQLVCLPILWLIFKKKIFKAYIAFILFMGLFSLLMIVVYYETLFSEWFKEVRVLYIICTISAICVGLQLFINKAIKNK